MIFYGIGIEFDKATIQKIKFYYETEEEYIFRCLNYGAFYLIPIDPGKLHQYLKP